MLLLAILPHLLVGVTQVSRRPINARHKPLRSGIPKLPNTSAPLTPTILLPLGKSMWPMTQGLLSINILSSNQGFFCLDCPKLFPRAPAQPSPSPSVRRRSPKPLTKARLLQERKAAWKRSRSSEKRSLSGPSIRGRWVAPGILSLLYGLTTYLPIFSYSNKTSIRSGCRTGLRWFFRRRL